MFTGAAGGIFVSSSSRCRSRSPPSRELWVHWVHWGERKGANYFSTQRLKGLARRATAAHASRATHVRLLNMLAPRYCMDASPVEPQPFSSSTPSLWRLSASPSLRLRLWKRAPALRVQRSALSVTVCHGPCPPCRWKCRPHVSISAHARPNPSGFSDHLARPQDNVAGQRTLRLEVRPRQRTLPTLHHDHDTAVVS